MVVKITTIVAYMSSFFVGPLETGDFCCFFATSTATPAGGKVQPFEDIFGLRGVQVVLQGQLEGGEGEHAEGTGLEGLPAQRQGAGGGGDSGPAILQLVVVVPEEVVEAA